MPQFISTTQEGLDPVLARVRRGVFHKRSLLMEPDQTPSNLTDAISARAVPVPLAGRVVRVATPEDLVAMKPRADRPQDDYDISEILRRGRVDLESVRGRVTDAEYDRLLAIRRRIGLA